MNLKSFIILISAFLFVYCSNLNEESNKKKDQIAAGSALLYSLNNQDPVGRVFIENNIVKSEKSKLELKLPDNTSNKSISIIAPIYKEINSNLTCWQGYPLPIDASLAHGCSIYNQYYLYKENLPSSILNYKSIVEYVNELKQKDIYTFYFEPTTYQNITKPSLDGEKATIGISLSISNNATIISDNDSLEIVKIVPFSRAWFDKLQVGDKILSINGAGLTGKTIEEAMSLLPKKESEKVTFSISRGNTNLVIETASEEHISFVLQNSYAYFRIKQFTATSATALLQDINTIIGANTIKGIILDLRNNGGGSFVSSLQITDIFIDKDTPSKTNPIVKLNGTIYKETYFLGDFSSTNLKNLSPNNFIVLVNENTASSSEILANALKYYKVAHIVGNKTYGKGVSQNVFELIDNSAIFVTSHSILGPDGKPYHGIGIEPDYYQIDTVTTTNDPQINYALSYFSTTNPSIHELKADINEQKNIQGQLHPKLLDNSQTEKNYTSLHIQ